MVNLLTEKCVIGKEVVGVGLVGAADIYCGDPWYREIKPDELQETNEAENAVVNFDEFESQCKV